MKKKEGLIERAFVERELSSQRGRWVLIDPAQIP